MNSLTMFKVIHNRSLTHLNRNRVVKCKEKKENSGNFLGRRNLSMKEILDKRSDSGNKIKISQPFSLELGGRLESLEISWKEWGNSSGPIILLCPSFSMGSHAHSTVENPNRGWWEEVIGSGCGLDTDKYRIICPDILGAPFGTTSPLSKRGPLSDVKDGVSEGEDFGGYEAWGPDFPTVTSRDQVRVHMKLLEHLKINKIHAVLGASLGGMQALAFAAEYPDFVSKLAAMCATGKTSPGTVAYRYVQRMAITTDPNFNGGRYTKDKLPLTGLAVARALGTICYRSRTEFDTRFQWEASEPYGPHGVSFEVESYLKAQAAKFNKEYDANCYLTLSKCADLMDLGRGFSSYEEGVKRIKADSFLVGFEHDFLIPGTELKRVSDILKENGKKSEFFSHPSIYGHDPFLKEFDWINEKLSKFLKDKG
eukprot:TRINITY_DN8491_c0_g1_i1.p1 TRINITY_DN8491_c0_g1~~TRINITY_DN8491_c0_g1_i1.p1  ORF type:complete len:424 (-),score=114.56 TRINITY_DN8491_c0_g1_i1:8-1279(-)